MHIINLLPKEKQQELRYEGMLHSMLLVVGISAVSFAIVFVVQVATRLYLQSEISSSKIQIEDLQKQVNKQDNAVLKQKIKVINDSINDFNGLADGAPHWSNILKAFSPLPPSGININTFVVDAQGKMVVISGYSPTRELVIQLHDNIAADSKHFYDVDYPLENIAQPKDIAFHFSFKIKDDLLK